MNGPVNKCAHDCYSHKCIANRHALHSHSQRWLFHVHVHVHVHFIQSSIPFPCPSTVASNHLLEHFPIRPRIFFAVHNNGLIPSPLIIQKLLILRLTGIELREFKALVIGCYVEGWLGVLAADDEGALDDRVVLLAVNGRGTEDVFAGGFEAGKEATYLICG